MKTKEVRIGNGKKIGEEASEFKVKTHEKQDTDDPQWLRGEYPSIPTMGKFSKLLCNKTDAICFLANRGVIEPCGICTICKGKKGK